MYYVDENNICMKCGKQLKSYQKEYHDYHDGGCYKESYRKVDETYCKRVGLNFYCNDCYADIKNTTTKEIVEEAKSFIEKNLAEGKKEIEERYQKKMKEMLEVEEYVRECISFLEKKERIGELSVDEMELLMKRNYIYRPAHQDIENGFCCFESSDEVQVLLNEAVNGSEKIKRTAFI